MPRDSIFYGWELGGANTDPKEKTMSNFKALFIQERTTKNTVRYEEQLESELDTPKIGKLYVQKTALAKLGTTIPEKLLVIVANAEELTNAEGKSEETVHGRVEDEAGQEADSR